MFYNLSNRTNEKVFRGDGWLSAVSLNVGGAARLIKNQQAVYSHRRRNKTFQAVP